MLSCVWVLDVNDLHQRSHEHDRRGMEDLLQYRSAPLKRLWFSLGITVVGMAVEIVGGPLTGSLALLSDAGHMFTHVFALGISALVLRFASRAPCHHRTFGLLRAEVLAASQRQLHFPLSDSCRCGSA
jgi:cobalt-zinc-cadmium efflux system protein